MRNSNRLQGLVLVLMLALAACDNIAPTLTPTRPISAPTLAASPEIFPFIPTNPAFEDEIAVGNDPTAAAAPRDSDLPPLAFDLTQSEQQIIIVGTDGTLINAQLYINPIGERAPGVLLLGTDRAPLLDLAARLHDQGFTTLVLNLLNAADFDTALVTFSQVSLVDPGRMAVIGVETFAPLALVACAANALCDGAALIAPDDDATMFARQPDYGLRGLFLAAGIDTPAYGVVERLRAAGRGEITFAGVPGDARGMDLFNADADLFPLLVAWLNAQFG